MKLEYSIYGTITDHRVTNLKNTRTIVENITNNLLPKNGCPNFDNKRPPKMREHVNFKY